MPLQIDDINQKEVCYDNEGIQILALEFSDGRNFNQEEQ